MVSSRGESASAVTKPGWLRIAAAMASVSTVSGSRPSSVGSALLTSDPSDSERATAELLNCVAATWDKQDLSLREHAQAVARTLPRYVS